MLKVAAPMHMAREEELSLCAKDGERAMKGPVNRVDSSCWSSLTFSVRSASMARKNQGKSQARKLTAAMAMPTPNRTPAMIFFEPPSPKAKVNPATTMETSERPRAMVVVNAVHQNIDGVLPGRSTGCLGEDCCGDEQRGGERDEYGPKPARHELSSEELFHGWQVPFA